jgi:hypothetical protein
VAPRMPTGILLLIKGSFDSTTADVYGMGWSEGSN